MGQPEIDALAAVIRRKSLYRGAGSPVEVEACEATLAEALGRRFALLTNSGTSALVLALRALGTGPGDEVIVPGYGWLTDVAAILHVGAVPVFIPVDPALHLDPAWLGSALSERTRVITPVHACGRPCDLGALREAAEGVPILDDACQAYGAAFTGDTQASVLSFQAFKLISCGEGGAIVTDDEALYRAAVRGHDAGLERFAHRLEARAAAPSGVGLNLRMSELSAAVLRCQLARVPDLLRVQADNAASVLHDLEPLVRGGCLTPVAPARGNHTYVSFTAASPELARTLAARFAAHGVPLRVAADDTTHALPGWLGWLRANDLPHHVVGEREAVDTLSRALVLEVPPHLPDATRERLRTLAERPIDSESSR